MSEGEKKRVSPGSGFKKEKDPGGVLHAAAGEKGGSTTLERYGVEHFVNAGRLGGEKVSKDRAYMAEIGRRGGRNRNKKNPTVESTLRGIAKPEKGQD